MLPDFPDRTVMYVWVPIYFSIVSAASRGSSPTAKCYCDLHAMVHVSTGRGLRSATGLAHLCMVRGALCRKDSCHGEWTVMSPERNTVCAKTGQLGSSHARSLSGDSFVLALVISVFESTYFSSGYRMQTCFARIQRMHICERRPVGWILLLLLLPIASRRDWTDQHQLSSHGRRGASFQDLE